MDKHEKLNTNIRQFQKMTASTHKYIYIGVAAICIIYVVAFLQYETFSKPLKYIHYNYLSPSRTGIVLIPFTDISPPGIFTDTNGGLGNQLFKYACVYAISQQWNIPLYINSARNEREFHLDKFSIPLRALKNVDNSRKLLYKFDDEALLFNSLTREIVDQNILWHSDYCESELFFRPYKKEIMHMFQLKDDPAKKNPTVKFWLDQMANCTSIAIHIRRGDFANGKRENEGWITPMRFFILAMDRIIRILGSDKNNLNFFIFSDSINSVKGKLFNASGTIDFDKLSKEDQSKENREVERLKSVLNQTGINVHFVSGAVVEGGKKLSVIDDFYLMTQSKHMIVSFSTFSWWSAYLIRNEEKVIIRPSTDPRFCKRYHPEMHRMFKTLVIEKYWYPKEWIEINPFFKDSVTTNGTKA